MAAVVTQFTQLCIDPLPYFAVYGSTLLSVALGTVTLIILASAFAYDAFVLAKDQIREL